MSGIPSISSFAGVPEYTVSYPSNQQPSVSRTLQDSISLDFILEHSPSFFPAFDPSKAQSNEPASSIPKEGEFVFVPSGYVPVLMLDSLASVVEYNLPSESIPLNHPVWIPHNYPHPPNLLKIYPPTAIASTAPTNPPKTVKKDIKTPRPTNAFILFRRENHGRIFQQSPHLSNNDVSKALGKEWKELPDCVKEVYRQKARSLQQEHQTKYPDYKFTPQQGRRKRIKPDVQQPVPSNEYIEQPLNIAPSLPKVDPDSFHILYIPKLTTENG
ncbi:hypothetical protein K7432_010753 [Basidiobolus ranarum]|uniref:HMG box domain-containing protein n=1 Tax=Basidiobolus ranarum TaxID=34480 RepID=A0ABR2VUY7_9FUNG